MGLVYLLSLFVVLLPACNSRNERQCYRPIYLDSPKQILLNDLRATCKDDTACFIACAGHDFRKGRIILFQQGLLEANSFRNHYIECIERNTVIHIIGTGCVSEYGIDCYNRTMSALIIERYGQNYLDSCRITAEKASEKNSHLRRSIW